MSRSRAVSASKHQDLAREQRSKLKGAILCLLLGGLAGINNAAISNCYAAGSVGGGTEDIGGLVGESTGTVYACLWDTQTSSVGGLTNNGAEMQSKNTLTMVGWDFATPVWKMSGQRDYPRLSSENYPAVTEGSAQNPDPSDGATHLGLYSVLSWTPGAYAFSHDVYLGIDERAVSTANRLAGDIDGNGTVHMLDLGILTARWLQDPAGFEPYADPSGDGTIDMLDFALVAADWKKQADPAFKGNVLDNSFAPGPLNLDTTYYWRIDEVNGPDTWRGHLWSFTSDNGKARNPSPSDRALGVLPYASLSWTAGPLATSHDVYFGRRFNDVNDANAAVTRVYKGRQSATSYNPQESLALGRAYYWRIDEVGPNTLVKGDVWSFKITDNIRTNVIVHYAPGKFCGWPANNGLLWHWGDNECAVGFALADFCCQGGHNNCGWQYGVIAKSTDGGLTWRTFRPANYVGDARVSSRSPGVNFTHPDFAMRVEDDEYYVSYDRCESWEDPYTMGPFGENTADSWEKTSRTDYIVNGPDDCLVFMSARSGGFGTDRAFCVRTTDGGKTFQFQGWIVPPSDWYRAVMPSTVRCSPSKLVSALRRRRMGTPCDAWVDVYVSNDNGVSWSYLSSVGETGCENGNPPALTRLSNGRLCCVYGNRTDVRMYMKYSDDEGISWSVQATLRDDWADCADDHQDLGYPRICQLADGRIITAYYWSTPDNIENHIAATIWDPH